VGLERHGRQGRAAARWVQVTIPLERLLATTTTILARRHRGLSGRRLDGGSFWSQAVILRRQSPLGQAAGGRQQSAPAGGHLRRRTTLAQRWGGTLTAHAAERTADVHTAVCAVTGSGQSTTLWDSCDGRQARV